MTEGARVGVEAEASGLPSVPLPPAERWRAFAACRGMDPALFFPGRGSSPARALVACGRCGVREECLSYALERRIGVGVWGRTTGRQRRRMLRRGRLGTP